MSLEIGKRIASRCLTWVLALAASYALFGTKVEAQYICLAKPPANNIVPGLGGPPDWFSNFVRAELNEPRWGAAPLTRFSNDPQQAPTSEGGIRVILNAQGTELSVSVQNKADSKRSAVNSVSFGIYKAGGTPMAATFPLRASSDNVLGQVVPYKYQAGEIRVHTYQRFGNDDPEYPSGDPEVPTTQPPHYIWSTGPASSYPSWIKDAGSWTTHTVVEGGADWAIQFKIVLANAGVLPGDTFRFAIGMRSEKEQEGGDRYIAEVGIPAQGDLRSWEYIPQASLMGDYGSWFSYNLSTACQQGISVADMGTFGNLNADGVEDAHIVDAKAGVSNKFYANLKHDGGGTISAGTVVANFKVANWGAQIGDPAAPWFTTVPNGLTQVPASGTVPRNSPTAYLGSTATRINSTCVANAGGNVCGIPKPTNAHQCVMVELAQAPGAAATVISSPVSFRNMRFEGLSEKRLSAEISTKGLLAKTGRSMTRTVLIDAITRNMAPHGNSVIWLDTWLMNQLKLAFLGLIQALNPFGLSLSSVDQMKTAWPTYETHVYYEAGHKVRINGLKYKVVRPMNSFGYFFSHDGLLFGYNHGMKGLGGINLKQIGTGGRKQYFVRVGNESTIKLESYVIAEEIPALLVDVSKRICQVFNLDCNREY